MWGRIHIVCRKRPQDVSRGRPMTLHIGQYGDVPRTLYWDVLMASCFTGPKDVGRRRPHDVGRGRPLALHRGPYGDVHMTSFGDVLRT